MTDGSTNPRAPLGRDQTAPDLPAALRSGLRAARTDGLDPRRRAALRQRLLEHVATAPSPTPGWKVGTTVVGAGALLVLGWVGWAWFGTTPGEPGPPDRAESSARIDEGGRRAPVSKMPAAATSPAGAEKPESGAPLERAPGPPESPAVDPPQRGLPSTDGAKAAAAPRDAAEGDEPAPGQEPNDTLEAEAALLLEARLALVERPQRSLALTEEHARRFPRPLLGDMREVVAIHALVRQDRRREAVARGRAFLEARPLSAYADRVRRLIAPIVEAHPAPAGEADGAGPKAEPTSSPRVEEPR